VIGAVCSVCERELEPAETVYREVSGWERVRQQGGANAITLRRESGRLACKACIDRRVAGLENQPELFA
jgi:hypothetical protein